jgi:uncharacterized protein DUF4159
MNRRALYIAVLLLAPFGATLAQRGEFGRTRRMLGDPNEFYVPPEFRGNVKYDGRFTFARIKYRGYGHFSYEGPGWSHDYPRAESHFMRILQEITTLRPFIESPAAIGGNILALDDPELFKYPVAYLSEPGGWFPTDKEVLGLRNYLLKGGFIIFDDFDGGSMDRDWLNFVQQMQRVLPAGRIVQLDATHPIFDAFFKVDLSLMERGGYRGTPVYFAIFQDNDPKKRIMAIINYNNDIGEYWQWSDRGFSPVPSNEAYKLGVNYIIYALTH